MSHYTNTFLALPEFITTSEAKTETCNGVEVTTLFGKMETNRPPVCTRCGSNSLHTHQQHTIRLKHLAVGDKLMVIEVTYLRWLCQRCGRLVNQLIPFKQEGHFITKTYYCQMFGLLERGNASLQHVAQIMHSNKNLVREIDKQRLIEKAGDMKPTHYSRFLGVDEFSLHKHHRYATIVIDLETGESLFIEEGNSELQLHHFFRFVGHDFMRHVKAIAMDMNAQYASAIHSRYPQIKIVYDPFHIIKNYNDKVISELRKAEQRRLTDALELAQKEKNKDLAIEITKEYKMFKNSRFVLLSNRKTLETKDAVAKEHSRFLFEQFEAKGLSLPPGERKWATNNLERLEQVLEVNEGLQTVYILAEMLKLSFTCSNVNEFKTSLDKWLKIASRVSIPELNKFCKMVERHYEGIINHAIFPISNVSVNSSPIP